MRVNTASILFICFFIKMNRLWKDHYSITKFLQYKDSFYVILDSDYVSGTALLKVNMITGKSILLGKEYAFTYLLFYQDNFYDIYNESLTQYNLQDKKIATIKLNKSLEGIVTRTLCIVDGRIYYGIFETESTNVKIGRCDLKGDRHELLFSSFAITEQDIFYLDAKNCVYKIDQSKNSEPMLVSSIPSSKILYADGHLMLEKCNKDEDRIIDVINEMECPISKS